MDKLVIIGSGSGGLPVASGIAKSKKDLYDITVITKDPDIAYSPCGIPFVLKGDIPSYRDLIMRTEEDYRRLGIRVLTGTAVREIDTRSRRVRTDSTWLDYDFLVIATGTAQKLPQVKGVHLGGVFSAHINTLVDAEKFDAYISRPERPLNVVITGSGSIDLEFAVGLKERGHNVIVAEKSKDLMPERLDSDMAKYVRRYLESRGIGVITGKNLLEIAGKDNTEAAVFDGLELAADIVLLGTHFTPEVTLARNAGIDTDQYGIVVDERSRVFRDGKVLTGVFASGACAGSVSKATGKPDFMYFGSTSIRRSAIITMYLLGKDISMEESTNPRIAVLGEMHIGAVGITSGQAAEHGMEVICGFAKGRSTARYYPGGSPVCIRLLFEKKSLRLIGAQVISTKSGVKERVDELSVAMGCGLTAEKLARIETAYTPPASPLIDVVVEAARTALIRI